MEALLPAFSMGLQQQTQTMEGWQNVLASLGQAQNSAQFFDSDGDGIPDHLENEGQNALGAMFGDPQTTQAVAQQAAQFAGLPAQMMQQMLPVIASMVMGGLFKGAMNGGLGGLLGQMMQGAGAGGMGGMAGGMGGLGSILGGMFGQPAQTPQQQAGNMFEQIIGGFSAVARRSPSPIRKIRWRRASTCSRACSRPDRKCTPRRWMRWRRFSSRSRAAEKNAGFCPALFISTLKKRSARLGREPGASGWLRYAERAGRPEG